MELPGSEGRVAGLHTVFYIYNGCLQYKNMDCLFSCWSTLLTMQKSLLCFKNSTSFLYLRMGVRVTLQHPFVTI